MINKYLDLKLTQTCKFWVISRKIEPNGIVPWDEQSWFEKYGSSTFYRDGPWHKK